MVCGSLGVRVVFVCYPRTIHSQIVQSEKQVTFVDETISLGWRQGNHRGKSFDQSLNWGTGCSCEPVKIQVQK